MRRVGKVSVEFVEITEASRSFLSFNCSVKFILSSANAFDLDQSRNL